MRASGPALKKLGVAFELGATPTVPDKMATRSANCADRRARTTKSPTGGATRCDSVCPVESSRSCSSLVQPANTTAADVAKNAIASKYRFPRRIDLRYCFLGAIG
jgi:hypothetical protein